MKLEGKVALVTGGGAGIGQGICLCLAEEGADVAVVDIVKESADAVVEKIKSLGRRSITIIADATEKDQVDAALAEVLNTFGRLDIVVNNVGGESKFYFEEPGEDYLEEKEFDDTVKLNLKSTVLMSRAVMPLFIKQRYGKIINIASVAGRPMPGRGYHPVEDVDPERIANLGPMAGYAVAKAGVLQFTRMTAIQLASYNVNVNCICPGTLYTPLYERSVARRKQMTPGTDNLSDQEYFDKYVAPQVPMGRGQTPEDIGKAVVFFASEDAKNITGQTINVDGGAFPS
ncbi:MAG: SDR family oxidoreductase [Dehalococcoidales bacterium]|nr:SDR family oxidoreductase [Dehalococcoidales bacterium]